MHILDFYNNPAFSLISFYNSGTSLLIISNIISYFTLMYPCAITFHVPYISCHGIAFIISLLSSERRLEASPIWNTVINAASLYPHPYCIFQTSSQIVQRYCRCGHNNPELPPDYPCRIFRCFPLCCCGHISPLLWYKYIPIYLQSQLLGDQYSHSHLGIQHGIKNPPIPRVGIRGMSTRMWVVPALPADCASSAPIISLRTGLLFLPFWDRISFFPSFLSL